MQSQSVAPNDEIGTFITDILAKILKVKSSDIVATIAFDRFGLDSAGAFKMVGALNERFGTDFEPTILYDHPTVNELAAFFRDKTKGA